MDLDPDSALQNLIIMAATLPTKQGPGTIDLIIPEILKHIPMSEIHKTRLVNSQWEKATTKILQQRSDPMTFSYNNMKNEYQMKNGWSLTEFNEFLSQSDNSKFPCRNFKLIDGSLRTVSDFLTLQGQFIHTIELDPYFWCAEEYLEFLMILRSILKIAPNLNNLNCQLRLSPSIAQPHQYCVEPFQFFNLPLPPFNELGPLTQLHRIDLSSNFPTEILTNILVVAVNLKIVDTFYTSWTPQFLAANKIHTVKNCNVVDLSADDLNSFYLFSNLEPQLKVISLPQNLCTVTNDPQPHENPIKYMDMTQGLMKILRSSSNSLQTIKYFEHFSAYPDILSNIVFKNVKTIIFGHNYFATREMVPHRCLILNSFPALETIEVTHNHKWDASLWGNLNPILSVKILKLNFDCTPDDVFEFFSRILPNLKSLVITVNKAQDGPKVLRHIWQCFKDRPIENLEVIVRSQIREFLMDQNSFSKMDSAITGFSIEDCERLRKNSNEISMDDIHRESPSILDLKSLKWFKINLMTWEDESHVDMAEGGQLFSDVTGVHGFDLMRKRQELTVSIGSPKELMNLLENIVPFCDHVFKIRVRGIRDTI